MKIRKLFRYLPATIMTASALLATTLPPYFANKSDYLADKVLDSTQQSAKTDYADQSAYIKNDVQKQAADSNLVKSIEFAESQKSTHSAAVVTKTDGSTLLYTWGRNHKGQLGIKTSGEGADKSTPTLVSFFNGKKIAKITLGFWTSAVILDNGELYMWGYNSFGQLGFASGPIVSEPHLIPSSAFANEKIAKIAMGTDFTVALTESGKLYTWGYNAYGQLGDNTTNRSTPRPVEFFNGKKITQIATGSSFTAAIENGILYTWGLNDIGQLGFPSTAFKANPIPTPFNSAVFNGEKIAQIGCGTSWSAALTEKGKLYTWGSNGSGQLGIGVKDDVAHPTPSNIVFFNDKTIKQISVGTEQAGVRLDDGTVWAWGDNLLSQLASGNNWDILSPARVPFFDGQHVATQINFGSTHSAAVLDDYRVYTWGENSSGQLGNGSTVGADEYLPTLMGLGRNSYIEANAAISAKEAVNFMYPSGKFSLDGFKRGFILNSIPDGGQSITMVSQSPDRNKGTVEIKFKAKYFYDENGLIIPKDITIARTISGFLKNVTKITALLNYDRSPVVDKWFNNIVYSGGDVVKNREELAKYLDLTTVPSDAIISIQNPDIKYAEGRIDFEIWSSKTKADNNASLDEISDRFNITLTLTPRVTKFNPVSRNPDNLTADQLRSKLFDSANNDKLKTTEFAKYQTIVAPADNAEYFLVPESYVFHTGDGTVKFKLYPNYYYAADGERKIGDDYITASHFSFNLQLNRTPTVIEEVVNYIPEIRVDHFINTVSNANGSVKDLATLKKYIKIEHLPSDSLLGISNVTYSSYTNTDYRDTVSFSLQVSKYNLNNNVIYENMSVPFTLKLLPQHKTTVATVRESLISPDRIDVFKTKIETSNGSELINYLKQYVDFVSLRNDAIVTANIANYDPYNGNLDLNLSIEKYYDNDQNENLGVKSLDALSITLKPAPTKVKIIKTKDLNVRLDRFVKTFADESTGVVSNLPILQQYVSFDVWDPNTTLIIDTNSIIMNNATGEWTGDLVMAEANDTDSSRVTNKRFPLKFQFAEKYDPTLVDQLPEYPLIQLDDFTTNLFDDNGVAKPEIFDYLDIRSLPPNAKIKLIEQPVVDYPNAQLTIKVEITSYYDQDSDLQESGPITRAAPWIKTFTFDLLSPETTITVAENYDATPRVDRFAASIKNLTNDNLKTALADYVDFAYLPANVNLSIDPTTLSITNLPGTLKFDILATRYFDAGGYLQTSIKFFPITLNLANKYATSNITAKTSAELPANKLRADRFIAALGASEASPEITNIDILNQYVNVVSLPVDTKLFVDYASPIDVNIDTGVINFSIMINQYYDNDSDFTLADLSFPINLTIERIYTPTVITAKTADLPNTRADRLLKTFMDTSTNKVTNLEVLKQYVDITSLPPAAQLYVANPVVNARLGLISFNLIASQYYSAAGDLEMDSLQTASHPFAINLQLTAKLDATSFSSKAVLPDSILVNELTNYLMPNGVVNLNRFKEYIDVVSLPENTKIELEETSHSITTGKITYNVKVNKYYDSEGDLQNKSNIYPVTLQLNPVYAETQIYALNNYVADLNVMTFKQFVTDTSGAVVLANLQKFVGIESLPSTSQLTIIWGAETNNSIDFVVHASQYYNAQHRLANDKDFNISLSFTGNVLPTNIKALDTYSRIGAHHFMQLVYPNNSVNYTQLSKYLDLTTVPFDASLTITNAKPNIETGVITFDITTSTWYDENKVHQTTDKTFNITLNLAPKYAETNLFGFASVKKDLTLDDFWLQISTNNLLDNTKLAHYVNLDTLVPNTHIQYLNPNKNWNGDITFDLIVDRFYDDDGLENIGRKVFKIVLSNLTVNLDQKQIIDYTWLYVTLALVFATLGGVVWFFIAKNKKHKEEKNS